MKVAVTGATGFIGRYILRDLADAGHNIRAWRRTTSDLTGLEALPIEWIDGDLTNENSMDDLVSGCDAIIHSALWKPGASFRGGEGDVAQFVETNVVGTLKLIRKSMEQGVDRFVFISTCAVHEVILEDRSLDEAHPLWPLSHYGAHKAAIEKFVHSYGLAEGYPICALRPTGVYGVAHPIESSKWFDLIGDIANGREVSVSGGGKEVHAADVAKAARILLTAPNINGQAYNCYDRYISRYEVANIAKNVSNSDSKIEGEPKSPKNQISTEKIRALGMEFGGSNLLRSTIEALVINAKKN